MGGGGRGRGGAACSEGMGLRSRSSKTRGMVPISWTRLASQAAQKVVRLPLQLGKDRHLPHSCGWRGGIEVIRKSKQS